MSTTLRTKLTKVIEAIEVARTKTRYEAMTALEEWRSRHPAAAAHLQPTDVLVDSMRGPSSIWYRIRINLQHVPTGDRPAQEDLIADYSPWVGYSGRQRRVDSPPAPQP